MNSRGGSPQSPASLFQAINFLGAKDCKIIVVVSRVTYWFNLGANLNHKWSKENYIASETSFLAVQGYGTHRSASDESSFPYKIHPQANLVWNPYVNPT